MRGSIKKLYVALEKINEIFGSAVKNIQVEPHQDYDEGDRSLVVTIKTDLEAREALDLLDKLTLWLIDGNDIKDVIVMVG